MLCPLARWRFLVVWLFVLIAHPGRSFYVPGVAPVEFKSGAFIEIKAIKLTSTRTGIPYDYYSVAFCRPEGDLHYLSENLGEVMRGDRIVNTPYQVSMKIADKCASSCADSKSAILSAEQSKQLRDRIKEDYHVHLLADNLPVAMKFAVPDLPEPFYDIGYQLGWTEGDKIYVNNHLEFLFKYHTVEEGVYRIVGFEVIPRSVADHQWADKKCSLRDTPKPLEIVDGQNTIHWTYSVSWEESAVPWASRWDVYLSTRGTEIHWFSILNSIIVVVCLSGFLSVSIVRSVRRDIAHYNRDDEEDDLLEESGWKLVHGDVFRPPRHQMILVNLVGTGVQLLGMTAVTVFFAMLGMLSPSSRGSLTSVAVFLYCIFGLIAGYQAGRLYKTLRGQNPKRCAFQTATLFPSIILGAGFVLNFFLIEKESSGAVPFTTMIALLFLWLGVDTPLVFLGFYFGYRKQAWTHPVRTNQIPRQVPEYPWWQKTLPAALLGGLLPFGAMFIELFFIFNAIWENQFYYLFGFLFIVSLILLISTAQCTIVAIYFMLCAENYRWWWKAFWVGGGSALYVMAYSVFFYHSKLNIVGFVPTVLYFSYSALMALTFGILTGTVGFYAAYWFLCRIYSAVKID